MKNKPVPNSIRALARFLAGYVPPRHPKPFSKRDRKRRAARKFVRQLDIGRIS